MMDKQAPEQHCEQLARSVADNMYRRGVEDEMVLGLKATVYEACLAYHQALIDEGMVIVPREQLEQLHMAGQIDAGVDPSWSNAQAYVIAMLQSNEQEPQKP